MPEQPDQIVEVLVNGSPVSTANPMPSTLSGGDIELGAVEIKDGASDQRATVNSSGEQLVKDTAGDTANGAVADAAWNGSGSGSIIAILKAVYAKLAATLGFSVNAGVTDATTLRVITASDGPLNTNLGTTTDAAVSTDANGSVSAKLRGLIVLVVNLLSRWPAALGAGGGLKTELTAATTATLSNVNDQATNIQLLASTAGRRGLIAFNDSLADLYLKYGATASATSFTVKILAGGYWEMPQPVYTGQIDGIWTSDSTGAVRLTELT